MRCTPTPITVYNAWKNPDTKRTVYRPTVLQSVRWYGTRTSKATITGLAPGDAITSLTTIYIWPSRLKDTQGREYIEPKLYAKLPPETVDNFWTLSDENDRIVKGIVEGAVVVEAIESISVAYSSVIKVGAVEDNRFDGPRSMRHWLVSGVGE